MRSAQPATSAACKSAYRSASRAPALAAGSYYALTPAFIGGAQPPKINAFFITATPYVLKKALQGGAIDSADPASALERERQNFV